MKNMWEKALDKQTREQKDYMKQLINEIKNNNQSVSSEEEESLSNNRSSDTNKNENK